MGKGAEKQNCHLHQGFFLNITKTIMLCLPNLFDFSECSLGTAIPNLTLLKNCDHISQKSSDNHKFSETLINSLKFT